MYITGTIIDFASRLHQLATTTGDLANFKTEVSGYWSTYDANTQVKLQTEANLKFTQLNTPQTGLYF